MSTSPLGSPLRSRNVTGAANPVSPVSDGGSSTRADATSDEPLYYEDPAARESLRRLGSDAGLEAALQKPTLKLTLSPPRATSGPWNNFGSSPDTSPPPHNRYGSQTSPLQRPTSPVLGGSSSSPGRNLGRELMSRLRRPQKTARPLIVTSADVEEDPNFSDT